MPSYILIISCGIILLITGIIIGVKASKHKSFQGWMILLLCGVTTTIGIILMMSGLGRL